MLSINFLEEVPMIPAALIVVIVGTLLNDLMKIAASRLARAGDALFL